MSWLKFKLSLSSFLFSLPDWLLRICFPFKRVIRGRALDIRIQVGLALYKSKIRPEELPPDQNRAAYLRKLYFFHLPKEDLAVVKEIQLEGRNGIIPAKLYSNSEYIAKSPGLLFFHGGGFVYGSVESHDAPIRYLAKYTGIPIISVEYSLSPEAKFPMAWNEAYDSYQFLLANGNEFGLDPQRISVGGDSAGGNLAISISTRASEEGLPLPISQFLIYPWLDMSVERPSVHEFGDDFSVTKPLLRAFKDHTFSKDEDLTHIYASPLLQESFSETPITYIAIAGFDPLQDEDMEYSRRLQKAGVVVTTEFYENLIHGFFTICGGIGGAKCALDNMVQWLKDNILNEKTEVSRIR